MKVTVCQNGARRRYMVPILLEKAGLLKALYTDSCEYTLFGILAKLLGRLNIAKGTRLANRKITGINKDKIYCSDIPLLYNILASLKKEPLPEYRRWCQLLSSKMIKWNKIDDSDIIYNMYCENLEFIRHIKKTSKAKIIMDVYQNPILPDSILKTKEKYGMDIGKNFMGIQNIDIKYVKEACEISDILLCPSKFVADGVRKLGIDVENKIYICPYGSSITYKKVNNPVKGRIFWAGGEWIRKGLAILGQTANQLIKKYPELEFRVAGVDLDNKEIEEFSNLHFLGKLNRTEMIDEYLKADMFVLPTLSEGMAGVVIEAMTAGCPVITTVAAGIDAIENGINGIIVEPNASDLFNAIENLYLNRDLRNIISEKSLITAKEYTLSAWQNRLAELINKIS